MSFDEQLKALLQYATADELNELLRIAENIVKNNSKRVLLDI